ncbi:hypothetical protein BS1321_14565 [Peribacillus simplex NBRC 15720 = DSM 1321]|uniref:Uncharacterized protein n=1 Tax=Peribacillus simplex NBRC 15720 = DSM 1321 TaxID=1349754 RepID=A0A223EIH7_9BACI|nr:hypothetical protein BS1321_14565 [Peribacillus simplex NBRC 15720 = DSM 1321]
MDRVKRKAVILIGLIAVLIILFVVYLTSPSRLKKVEIVEKYYPHFSDGKAVGFKTNEVIDVTETEEGSNCAMKFNNGKTLEIDCDRYLTYKIDETVYITTEGNHVKEIRRKR